jgi:hypothetical protein
MTTKNATLPIVRHLSESELARRQASITEEIFRQCREVNELADGYEFHFPGDDEWFTRLTEFVAVERKRRPTKRPCRRRLRKSKGDGENDGALFL